jgi:hypothetical protein
MHQFLQLVTAVPRPALLATRAKSNDDTRRLLLMSEAWLHLADKASRLAGQLETTERLIRGAFSENSSR